jgi:gluconolactonase
MTSVRLATGLALLEGLGSFAGVHAQAASSAERPLPEKAQIIDQRSFLVLEEVLPPSKANATTVCIL